MSSDEPVVRFGKVSRSTFAVGSHAHAESHHYAAGREGAVEDQELLEALRELRSELAGRPESPAVTGINEAIDEAEEEITRTGRAGESRRARLRERLESAEGITSWITAAAAVAAMLGVGGTS
jgi:aspartate/methionine/tyrosine aminotransferase